MIELLSLGNPKFSASNQMIDLDVETEILGKVACSFHPDDEQEYLFKGSKVTNGDIYRMAEAGEFGLVTPLKK